MDVTPWYIGRIGSATFRSAYVIKNDPLKIAVRPLGAPITIRHKFDDGTYSDFTADAKGELQIPNPSFMSGVHVKAGELSCYGGFYKVAEVSDTHSDAKAVPSKFNPPPLNRSPEFAALRHFSVQVGQRVRFNVKAIDPDGDDVTITCHGPKCNGRFHKFNKYSWVPKADEVGQFTLSFRAEDGKGGSDTELVRISVKAQPPRNQRPVIESISSKRVFVGDTLKFEVKATDPDGDELGYRCVGIKCAHFNLKSRIFSWTPESDDVGRYLTYFRVADAKGDVDGEALYIIVEKNPNAAPYEVDQIIDAPAEAAGLLLNLNPSGPNYGEDIEIVINIIRKDGSAYQTSWDSQVGIARRVFIPRRKFDANSSHSTVKISAGIRLNTTNRFMGFSPPKEVKVTP